MTAQFCTKSSSTPALHSLVSTRCKNKSNPTIISSMKNTEISILPSNKRNITEIQNDINFDVKCNAIKLKDTDTDTCTDTDTHTKPNANVPQQNKLPSKRSLTDLSKDELDFCLQPILTGLRSIEPENLLQLETLESGGALLREGVRIRPIHDKVEPPSNRGDGNIVRYIHLNEVIDQYSSGVFIFPPNSKIPLHDHPGMSVVSRLLYGDMHVLSLDLLRDGELDKYNIKDNQHPLQHLAGAKFAIRRCVDHIQAPNVGCLYPYEGNLHEFTAGPDGAAILDILLPPYDGDNGRDCTFYEIHNVNTNEKECAIENLPKIDGEDEICLIVPTGQPEDFHCISGRYLDLGTPTL